ncbi:peptidoglycan-binding domain-containing protein [Micromonospora sp. WMMD718]|uniref:peptidoglycan-binding domain-containing protein n=1 Tax=unclassified Micromonospora TaxID=2617518 RepID=UPI00064BE708|nr:MULTISPECIES: peptidoglycan-binding domain-containing protein [unclassified Micromonospora]MDG4752583.1 peptidoglycan-binding domain-containing protein [Micromonospora sp. WMMD718]
MISRRNLLLAAGAAVASAGPLARPAVAALPQVDMEALIKAAQIDPRRAGTALTEGARDSVLEVERALQARGLLSATYVDGHFGTSTIAAYAAYQRSLGYSGLDATGLPGPTSLRLLGEGRYTVVRAISPGSVVTLRGVLVNTRTRSMLFEAERLLGRQLGITQGSYNTGVGTSAGTHDGGGALDLSVSGLSSATRTDALRRLRTVGFAAWLRTPDQGDWGYHVHAVALADTDQSTGAQNQAGDYYLGRNGLANRGADDGPAVSPKRTWEEYQRTL